jgi:tetratricopeptide (TPR) repeat protein
MEMGLIEDAEQKFKRAASVSSGAKSKVSLGAHGMVAFMMGRRDWQDGKVGVALSRVMEAIEQCAPLAQNSSTLSRLVGDMHSFLAVFPSELFQKQRNREEANDIFKSQLEIIARGMEYYNSSLSIVEQSFPSDESMSLRADLVCDKAVNILLRAQLWAQSQNMSQKDCRPDQEVMDLFSSAQECFEEALQIDPLHAVAWCGMGCSLVGEPLKAQHAFCRAIELDSSSPDSYANLGFLYMERNAMSQGAEVCDRLTQVADTQMTWINRALQIEAGMPHADSLAGQGAYVEQLSDAYRAALQLQRDSFALIGLAASFRIMSAAGRPSRADTWENGVLIQEYQSFTSSEYPLQVALPQKDGDASDHDFTDSVNAAKHAILTRPDDGNAWLALSKRLLLDSSDGRDDYSTSSARVAAERARRLFLETLTNHVGNKITRAPASQVSDALALVSWLNSSTSIEQPTSPCSKEAQLALLICPRNTLARAFVERNTQ